MTEEKVTKILLEYKTSPNKDLMEVMDFLENDFQDHCSWNDALKVMSIIDSAELSSQENFKTINIGKDNV